MQEQEKLTFPQAVERLSTLAGTASPSSTPAKRPPVTNRSQLLERVTEHYHQSFEQSQEAKEYLESRKLWDQDLFEGFKVGFCGGSLLKTLPRGGEIRESLTEIGILNAKGREHFLGCLVVPLEHPTQGFVGMYGRRLNPKAKVRHLFLPGPKLGVFGFQALRDAKEVFLTEGVLDAMSLWLAGIRPVTCAYGTGGLPEELERFLRSSSVRELKVCFDSDRAGEAAVERLTDQVGDRFKISKVLLPAGDPNDILIREGPEVLRTFMSCLQPVEVPGETDPELPLTETTDTGFSLTFPDLVYQVTPQPPYTGRLKVMIRAERTNPDGTASPNARAKPKPLKFLDRCDLVSSRSRSEVLRGLSQRLSLDREKAEEHLSLILDITEEWVSVLCPADGDGKKEAPVLTEVQKREALDFLQAPNLVNHLLSDMETLGYVGEERGKLLVYLVGLSRKLENPLSAIIRSQSGAGKSGLSSLVGQLTPPEDVVHYSRVSAQALAYAAIDAYKRKLLIMEERIGGDSADYYIRILQSSHKICQAVAIKDPVTGQMRTQEFEVEGPIAYIETTTDSHINPENSSRCFEIFLDETEEQTARIHDLQRAARSLDFMGGTNREKIFERHHNAQRMLDSVKVVIPYVEHLTFPTRWLRTRRDNERFLCLIEVLAFLHQHQRVRKSCRQPNGEEFAYIEATVDDYRMAYDLAKDVLRDTLHELSISAREVLQTASVFGEEFTRRDLRAALKWSQKRIHQAVHELVDMEYLTAVTGGNGKTYHYSVIGEVSSENTSPVQNLLHPDELARKLQN